MDGVPKSIDGLEHTVKYNGFKGIELQLPSLCRHGNGHVISDDVKGHLVHHLRNYRIHLSRHNGRPILLFWKIDLMETSSWAGGHEPQVIGDFGQGHGTSFHRAGNCHKGVQILGGINQVKGLHQLHAADLCQIWNNASQINRIGIEAGSHCSSSHIQGPHFIHGFVHPVDIPHNGHRIGFEFLPQADGHGVLHLGAAHFQHVVKLLCFLAQRLVQPAKFLLRSGKKPQGSHFSGCGNDIVGRLAAVDMVIGIDNAVISFFPSQNFDGTVGNHLIGVHI